MPPPFASLPRRDLPPQRLARRAFRRRFPAALVPYQPVEEAPVTWHARPRGRPPADDELAAYMGVTAEKFGNLLLSARASSTASLDVTITRDSCGGNATIASLTADTDAADPAGAAQRRDLRALLARGLSKTERLIIILYYYEELTMKEIGATLDLSESRVSQLHSSIMERLKRKVGGRRDEFLP